MSNRKKAPSRRSGRARASTKKPSKSLPRGGDQRQGFRLVSIFSIQPSPENDKLYHPPDPDDPEIVALADSIRERGVLEPLVITADNWIISGHRRYLACLAADVVKVPVRVNPIKRSDDPDGFVRLLAAHNLQREKTFDEKLREELLSVDSESAYQSLIQHRRAAQIIDVPTVEIEGTKHRSRISAAKQPMLQAALRVIEARRKFWPLSVRAVHYALLNEPPRRNANRPGSTYRNDRQSYQDLSNLLTRARLAGVIPWPAISDQTRPTETWNVYKSPRSFIRNQLDSFGRGYWRDLMQSQPNHVEVICEKNTALSIVQDVTMRYCIPTMSGRGFSSIDPYCHIADRFRASGKATLILIVCSDFDPEGEEIVQVAGRTLRDDFGVYEVEIIKAAITPEQIERYELPPMLEAKEGSSRFKKFVAAHGTSVYELEALTPEQLQDDLQKTIDGVIDLEAFNAELDAEKADAAEIDATRRAMLKAIGEGAAGPD